MTKKYCKILILITLYGLFGMTVIAETLVNVKSFGAVGDGSHDDTASIKKALQSMIKGGVLYFPPGEYKIMDTIRIPHEGTTLKGANRENTIIRYLGNKFINVIEINFTYISKRPWLGGALTTPRYPREGIKLKNLTISGGTFQNSCVKYVVYAKYLPHRRFVP